MGFREARPELWTHTYQYATSGKSFKISVTQIPDLLNGDHNNYFERFCEG